MKLSEGDYQFRSFCDALRELLADEDTEAPDAWLAGRGKPASIVLRAPDGKGVVLYTLSSEHLPSASFSEYANG
jgi:hypothetical protein